MIVPINNCDNSFPHYTFANYQNYVDTVSVAKPVWHNNSSRSSDDDWCGGVNYAGALEMLLYKGYPEGAAKLNNKLAILEQSKQFDFLPASGLDVAGAYPIVPIHVAGDAYSMMTPEDSTKKNVVNILAYNAFHSGVSADTVANRGAAILSLVNQLELQDISVKLAIVRATTGSDNRTCFASIVPIKAYGEALDLDKIAFQLMHVAAFRRLGFALIETMPDLHQQETILDNSYGGRGEIEHERILSEYKPDVYFKFDPEDDSWKYIDDASVAIIDDYNQQVKKEVMTN